MKHTPKIIKSLKKNQIFVFGSNLAGRHGAGAALYAKNNFGAIYGQGVGLQGQSYGIPTKDTHLFILFIFEIKKYIDDFIEFAKIYPELEFLVTPIGCGLANFNSDEIAPMFKNVSENIILPLEFIKYIKKLKNLKK